MTAQVTTAFWSMTINNPTETDMALVRNGYGDYCRELIHTLEVGENGTPHIQAWVKLQRQQRMSFMKKLFPRGHFRPLKNDEYVENTKAYAQKNDGTTEGLHVHVFHDPTDTIESVVKKVALRMMEDDRTDDKGNPLHVGIKRCKAQKLMVIEDYRLAKMFVSATYEKMWSKYEKEMFACLCAKKQDTHTHTHTQEETSQAYVPMFNSLDEYYNTNGENDDDQEGEDEGLPSEERDSESDEGTESEADEGCSEGASDQSDEEDDESEY